MMSGRQVTAMLLVLLMLSVAAQGRRGRARSRTKSRVQIGLPITGKYRDPESDQYYNNSNVSNWYTGIPADQIAIKCHSVFRTMRLTASLCLCNTESINQTPTQHIIIKGPINTKRHTTAWPRRRKMLASGDLLFAWRQDFACISLWLRIHVGPQDCVCLCG